MSEGEESGMYDLGACGDATTIVPDFQVASTHCVMGHRSCYQRTRGMATTRHRSLVERGGRKALSETLHTPKKMSGKTDIHESQENIRTHIASSKATRLFLSK